MDDDAPLHPGLDVEGREYLGPVLAATGSTVQMVEPRQILTDAQRAVLFGRTKGVAP
jgi:hypothetical protein